MDIPTYTLPEFLNRPSVIQVRQSDTDTGRFVNRLAANFDADDPLELRVPAISTMALAFARTGEDVSGWLTARREDSRGTRDMLDDMATALAADTLRSAIYGSLSQQGADWTVSRITIRRPEPGRRALTIRFSYQVDLNASMGERPIIITTTGRVNRIPIRQDTPSFPEVTREWTGHWRIPYNLGWLQDVADLTDMPRLYERRIDDMTDVQSQVASYLHYDFWVEYDLMETDFAVQGNFLRQDDTVARWVFTYDVSSRDGTEFFERGSAAAHDRFPDQVLVDVVESAWRPIGGPELEP